MSITNNYNIVYSGSLAHHGILGQKWGVRRYQNEDGTLTEAGKLRYDTDQAKQHAKETRKAAFRLKMDPGRSFSFSKNRQYLDALRDNRNAIRDLNKAKLKEKAFTQTKISDRQKKFIEDYKSKGMSDEDAKLAAYKRIHTERAMIAIGGATLASVAAYGAYRYVVGNKDRIIKSGTILQNISTDSNKGVSDAFYAARSPLAKSKYVGSYGAQLKQQQLFGLASGDGVHKMKATIGSDGLKVASEKNALKALQQLSSEDPQFRKALHRNLSEMDYLLDSPMSAINPQSRAVKKGLKSLESGKIDKSVYKAFNIAIPNHYNDSETTSKVYDRLKKMGYGAIQDVNDRIGGTSGYNVADPLIVFDGSKISKVTNKKVGGAEVALKYLAPMLVSEAASTTAYKKINLSLNEKNDRIITEYKKEHPDTKLSDFQIVKNYKKNHSK